MTADLVAPERLADIGSYFSICNAGVATCPPNRWGGCGYSYNQVRDLHPVQTNSFDAGTDHLTSVRLR